MLGDSNFRTLRDPEGSTSPGETGLGSKLSPDSALRRAPRLSLEEIEEATMEIGRGSRQGIVDSLSTSQDQDQKNS